ncbi:MAG: hypothetical protein RL685_4566 [Pseudomonadota bacterium]|jgi:hypothetical protein
MARTVRRRHRLLSAGLLALITLVGCSSNDNTRLLSVAEPAAPAANNPAAEGTAEQSRAQPAVMVAIEARSPEDQKLYVGAFPELPRDDLDLSRMIEAGNASSARTANGYVYLWDGEASTYTRYTVDEALALVSGPRVSFGSFGVTGPALTHFADAQHAYTMLSDAEALVVWNPTSMEVLGSTSTAALFDPDYPRVEYGEPVGFGEYVAWPILWSDYDNLRFKPEVGVALVAREPGVAPIVLRDGRCGAGWSLFKDEAGDLYAIGNGYFGFAHFFGEGATSYPDDCVLRIRAGQTEFDPNYARNLSQLANTPAVYHAWSLEGRTLYAAIWDPADDPALLADSDAYWEAPLLRTLVRLDESSSTPIPGLPKSAVWSTLDYRLDGTLYLLESQGSLDDAERGSARSSLYRVAADGVERAFSTSGEVQAIGRIR